MKRSKIILATTTAILAVAGVFAAKAHQFTNIAAGFYSNGNGCTLLTPINYYTAPVIGAVVVAVTEYSPNTCTGKPLFDRHATND